MSTHALDPHHDDHGNAPLLSGIAGKMEERMPSSLRWIYERTKNRVTQVLNMPRQIREMIDRVKDGHPLSKAEWTAISALPLWFLVAGYYILKVAENTGNGIIREVKWQYHAMLEGLGLNKEATPDAFPAAIANHEAHHDHTDQAGTDHHAPKPKNKWAPLAHIDAHAANDDHALHHGEHPGEDAHAA
jgi:hypothetical protein